MKLNNIYIFLMTIVLFGIPVFADEQEIIELCDFKVPYVISRANANFWIIYSMDIDSTGTPININKVSNSLEKYMSGDPFIECFQKWKLSASYGKVDVGLYWKHAAGWTTMSLTGKNVSRTWRFEKGWQAATEKTATIKEE